MEKYVLNKDSEGFLLLDCLVALTLLAILLSYSVSSFQQIRFAFNTNKTFELRLNTTINDTFTQLTEPRLLTPNIQSILINDTLHFNYAR